MVFSSLHTTKPLQIIYPLSLSRSESDWVDEKEGRRQCFCWQGRDDVGLGGWVRGVRHDICSFTTSTFTLFGLWQQIILFFLGFLSCVRLDIGCVLISKSKFHTWNFTLPKACPDAIKKDGYFHLAPPNLKFVLWPRTDIELPSNYAEFDSALDCIKELFFI